MLLLYTVDVDCYENGVLEMKNGDVHQTGCTTVKCENGAIVNDGPIFGMINYLFRCFVTITIS